MLLTGVIPGIALLLLSLIYVVDFVIHLVTDPAGLFVPMLYGLALGVAWLLWIHVPLLLIRTLRHRRRGT